MRLARVAGALALLAVLLIQPATVSQAASTFSATAGGEVVRVLVNLEPAVLQADLLDPGALTAQASLTSFGESTAFASTPYPGSLPVALPGTIDGLFGMSLPPEFADLVNLPEYPLIASSSYPATPTSEVELASMRMRADSRKTETVGVAADGANRTDARVVVDEATDVVTATATVEVGGISLGPPVQLGGIRSLAQVVQAPDGELERTTDFTVATISILGQQVRLSEDGFELLGINLPAGLGDVTDPLEVLLGQLTAQTGITVRFIPAQETPDGVISAGLEIQRQINTDVNGIVATVTMTFGRAHANVSNAARPPLVFDGVLPPSTPSSPDFPISGTTLLPSVGPNVSSPVNTDTSTTATGSSEQGDAGGTPIANLPIEPARGLVPDTTDAGRFYPLLVFGAAVFTAGISIFRKFGVRSPWTS